MIDEYDEWSTGFWIVLVLAGLGLLLLVGFFVMTMAQSLGILAVPAV